MFKLFFNNYKMVNNIFLKCEQNLFIKNGQYKFMSSSQKFTKQKTLEDFSDDSGTPATAVPELVPVNDIDREKKLKILQLEVDVACQEGRRVPNSEFFKPEHWEHALSLKSRSSRLRFYSFLWQIEMKKQNREIKKLKKNEKTEENIVSMRKERADNEHIIYGIGHTSILLRIYDTTINLWQNNRLTRAMQFAEKIVMDCSFDDCMTKREQINTAKQFMLCFAQNRSNDQPFDLHFCNVNFDGTTMKYLGKHIPTMRNLEFPMNLHEKCFTEIFPKNKIVYLTPHCRTDLNVYNPDDIYIIGGIVDKTNSEPVSLAKAKKLGLRMARLPLDKYLAWGAGSGKSLTINQMIDVMLDLKNTGDWNYSLKHVPTRKLYKPSADDYKKKQETKLRFRAKKLDFSIEKWGEGDNPFKKRKD